MDKASMRKFIHKKQHKHTLDNFVVRVPKQKAKQKLTDISNLLQVWLHALLYYKRIYPSQCFQKRTAFGIETPTANSPEIKNYLNNFFQKMKPHLSHVSHLEVKLIQIQTNNLIQICTLNILMDEELTQTFWDEGISINEGVRSTNIIQKELEYKKFINQMEGSLTRGFIKGNAESVTFKLNIGYRMENNLQLRKEKRKLLDGWVQIDRGFGEKGLYQNSLYQKGSNEKGLYQKGSNEKGQQNTSQQNLKQRNTIQQNLKQHGTIVSSLKSPLLNLIYEVKDGNRMVEEKQIRE